MPFKVLHPKRTGGVNVPSNFVAFGVTDQAKGKILGVMIDTAGVNPTVQGIPISIPGARNAWRLYFKGLKIATVYNLQLSSLTHPNLGPVFTVPNLTAIASFGVGFTYPSDPGTDANQCSACFCPYGTFGGGDTGVLSVSIDDITDIDPFLDPSSNFWCATFYSVPDGSYNLSAQGNGVGSVAVPLGFQVNIVAANC